MLQLICNIQSVWQLSRFAVKLKPDLFFFTYTRVLIREYPKIFFHVLDDINHIKHLFGFACKTGILVFFLSFLEKPLECLQNKLSFIALHITNLSHKVGKICFSYNLKQPNLQPLPGALISVHWMSCWPTLKYPAGISQWLQLTQFVWKQHCPEDMNLFQVAPVQFFSAANGRLFLKEVRRHYRLIKHNKHTS